MKNLLLLTCGTNACYHIAKVLKEKFQGLFRVIGTDVNQQWLIPSSPYIDKFYQCPYTSDSSYYQFILKICEDENINFLLPSYDADQLLFYVGNPDLLALGVTSLGIPNEIRKIYSSKISTNEFLQKNNLPTPQMYKISEIEADKKYFVKPINGVGSKDARVIEGKELLVSYKENILIEEVCFEPEVTLECFNYSGKLFSVARTRLACKSGVCTKTRIYHDSTLQAIAEKLAQKTRLPYIFNLQFMHNTEGRSVITDLNLRTAGGMSLSFAAGWDEVSALAKIMLNKDDVLSTLSLPIKEQFVIRAYNDIVTKTIEKKIAFDLDGTLLDSRLRHSKLMSDILKRRNIEISTDDLVSYKTEGHSNVAWLISKGIHEGLATEIQTEWVSLIENYEYLACDFLYPNTISMLERLSRSNSLYLLTARSNVEGTKQQISHLGIKQYFEEICIVPSGRKASQLKANFLKCHSIDVMIGDTEIDMFAANEIGCKFFAIRNGFRNEHFWEQYNVTFFDGFFENNDF